MSTGNTTPKLNGDNYYSSKDYMSVSLFKAFAKCEASALATLRGEYEEEKGEALYLGSFVDELLTGTPESREKFLAENHDIVYKRDGKLRENFARAQEAVTRLNLYQPYMLELLSGEHQTIMTGQIEGVPFKIKMDSYKPGEFIADLKYMKSLRSPNLFQPMIQYWGYDLQAAAYQEIVYQNTGHRLPFYFVVITKEQPAHYEVGEIPQEDMDAALETIRQNIVHYWDIVQGKTEAERCEDYNCDYCTLTHVVTEPVDTNTFGMSAKQRKAMKGEV